MKNTKINYNEIITIDTDNIIDDFFTLSSSEKELVRGLKIHKNMRESGLRLDNKPNDFKRLYLEESGIYIIQSIIDKKSYIGQSINIERRIYNHLNELKRGAHYNPLLQESFNKYGASNFLCIQLEKVSDISLLDEREDFWNRVYAGKGDGFNVLSTPIYKELVVDMCHFINLNLSSEEIADKFNCSSTVINTIRSGRNWREISENILSNEIKELWWDKEPVIRFSEEDIIDICEKLNDKVDVSSLAEKFNCSNSVIRNIRSGKSWSTVSAVYLNDALKKEYWDKEPNRILSENEVVEICRELNKNITPNEIAEEFNCLANTVQSIRRGTKWRDIGKVNLTNEIMELWWNKESEVQFEEEDIIKICEELNNGRDVISLAEIYKCSITTIRNIRSGRSWIEIGEKFLNQSIKTEWWNANPRRNLSANEVIEICEDINLGLSIGEISQNHNVSEGAVYSIRRGQYWDTIGEKNLNGDIKRKWWTRDSVTQFSEDEISAICNLINKNTPSKDIATLHHCSIASIVNIRKGVAWREITENMLCDKVKKKYWESDGRSNLNEDIVSEICIAFNSGKTVTEILDIYDTSKTTLISIRSGNQWRDVGEKFLNEQIKGKYWNKKPSARLDEPKVIEICNELNKGITPTQLGKKMGYSQVTINNIRKGKSWVEVGEKYLDDKIKELWW